MRYASPFVDTFDQYLWLWYHAAQRMQASVRWEPDRLRTLVGEDGVAFKQNLFSMGEALKALHLDWGVDKAPLWRRRTQPVYLPSRQFNGHHICTVFDGRDTLEQPQGAITAPYLKQRTADFVRFLVARGR